MGLIQSMTNQILLEVIRASEHKGDARMTQICEALQARPLYEPASEDVIDQVDTIWDELDRMKSAPVSIETGDVPVHVDDDELGCLFLGCYKQSPKVYDLYWSPNDKAYIARFGAGGKYMVQAQDLIGHAYPDPTHPLRIAQARHLSTSQAA